MQLNAHWHERMLYRRSVSTPTILHPSLIYSADRIYCSIDDGEEVTDEVKIKGGFHLLQRLTHITIRTHLCTIKHPTSTRLVQTSKN